MSKKIVMSVLASIALSIGGFFASCGSNAGDAEQPVVVEIPSGCSLASPKDIGLGSETTPTVLVKPGPNKFIVDSDQGETEVDRNVKPGQTVVDISLSDLR